MFSFGVDVAQAPTKLVAPPSNSVIDEEAQKRNTDCIYFLASPLTCKKGTSCEYRHSEAARMNTRDCRYWKAGNCLNPRCPFRHLPFDGKSVLAASVASTSSAPVIPQLAPATAPSNKSKTPCYFFSQGYCTKNDKCPFMHGTPAASRADAAAQKNPAVVVNGKAVQSSGRPLIVLNQSASTDGRPAASNGSNTSKAPITSQEMSQISSCLEKAISPERDGIFGPFRHYEEKRKSNVQNGRFYDVEQSHRRLKAEIEQGLNDTNDSQGMYVGTVECRHPSQVDEDCPASGSGLDQSVLHSDSHQTAKSPSNSTASNEQDSFEQLRSGDSEGLPEENWEPQLGCFRGQCQVFPKHVADARVSYHERAGKLKNQRMGLEEQDSSPDLRNHLMKRRKKNSLHAVSEKPEVRGKTDMVISGRGSQRLSEDHFAQQNGKLLATADIDGTKVGGRESFAFLQRASLSKVSNNDKCLALDNRPSGGTSEKETLNFAGPKSLAQIKAEKMAGRESAIGKRNLSSTIIESFEKVVATRKLAKPAEVTHVAVSTCNLSSSPVSTDFTMKSIYDKQESVTSLEFEGPKPLSLLLKRKPELESDVNFIETMESDVNFTETMPGPLKAELSMLGSCRELEDGEVGDDSQEYKEEGLPSISCPSIFVKKDLQAISPSSREVVERGGAETAEFDLDLSEELKSDAEMEDIAYGDADDSIDDDNDDDDEEDFAKKLGRFFALSSN